MAWRFIGEAMIRLFSLEFFPLMAAVGAKRFSSGDVLGSAARVFSRDRGSGALL